MENIEQRYITVLKIMHSYLSEKAVDPDTDYEFVNHLMNGIAKETRSVLKKQPSLLESINIISTH